MQVVGSIALLAAGCLMALAAFVPPEIRLALPFSYSPSLTVLQLLAATLVCGLVAGFSLYALFNAAAPSAAAVALAAAVAYGAALVVAMRFSGDWSVARVMLLLLIGGFAIEGVRREIALWNALQPPPIMRRLPLWAAAGAPLMFAIPALVGDAAPARTGLGLCLGAGALASAFVAARGMQSGEVLEVTSWAGGLGGGRAGFRLSRATGQLLLTLVLAGAAVASLSPPSIEPAKKETPAAGMDAALSNRRRGADRRGRGQRRMAMLRGAPGAAFQAARSFTCCPRFARQVGRGRTCSGGIPAGRA
jgi:hypothetical protein